MWKERNWRGAGGTRGSGGGSVNERGLRLRFIGNRISLGRYGCCVGAGAGAGTGGGTGGRVNERELRLRSTSSRTSSWW